MLRRVIWHGGDFQLLIAVQYIAVVLNNLTTYLIISGHVRPPIRP